MSKKDKAPLTRCNGTLTESQYLAWIRSALRSKSLRWEPRNTALQLARTPYSGPNKRQKWQYQCAICKQQFTLKEVVVDHYPEEAGSILSVEDIGPFAERLYCEVDNLRVLCEWDHRIHTLQSSKNISREEAILQIKVNDTMKDKKKTLALLQENGYNNASNDEKRKQALREIFLKESVV
jgi:hypothetical protein